MTVLSTPPRSCGPSRAELAPLATRSTRRARPREIAPNGEWHVLTVPLFRRRTLPHARVCELPFPRPCVACAQAFTGLKTS